MGAVFVVLVVVVEGVFGAVVACVWGVSPMKGSLGQLSYQRPLLTPNTLHKTVQSFQHCSALLRIWHVYKTALCYNLQSAQLMLTVCIHEHFSTDT